MPRTSQIRKVSANMKKIVAYEQEYKCNTCKKMLPPSWECDHIIPLWKEGSSNHRENLQALCAECHSAKTLQEGIERYDLQYGDHIEHSKPAPKQISKPLIQSVIQHYPINQRSCSSRYLTCHICNTKYSPYFEHKECFKKEFAKRKKNKKFISKNERKPKPSFPTQTKPTITSLQQFIYNPTDRIEESYQP